MEVTKDNIFQKIEDHLKKEGIRWTLEPCPSGKIYSVHISSIESEIIVMLSDDDEEVEVQLYDKVGDPSIYHSVWLSNYSKASIEDEIDEFLSSVRRISMGINSIRSKVEQIEQICQEYELDFDDIISFKYYKSD
jgi:hypothetical protein